MEVFDPLRKKNVALTPEEGVRQSFIKWLQEKRGWPLSVMMSETQINIGAVMFRCDIVCYNKQLEPQMIVECKAPDVKITKETFEQIWRYAIILKVKWLAITNGVATFACEYDNKAGEYKFISDIPRYEAQ